MKKYKRNEIAKIILLTLLAVGVISIGIVAPNALHILKYFKPKNAHERTKIRRSVRGLQQQGFIKEKTNSHGVITFILTEKGKKKIESNKIKTMEIVRQEKWDRKWRLIMFDIPEEMKTARHAIHKIFKKFGCQQYQKSVFVTPFPCSEEIDFVGKHFNVRKYIQLIVAEDIEQANLFKKSFRV